MAAEHFLVVGAGYRLISMRTAPLPVAHRYQNTLILEHDALRALPDASSRMHQVKASVDAGKRHPVDQI